MVELRGLLRRTEAALHTLTNCARLTEAHIPRLRHTQGQSVQVGPTGQPTAMAGDTLRVIMDMGKFQGVMAATTPTGCLMTTGRLVALTGCSTSPFTRRHSSANHSMDATLHPAPDGLDHTNHSMDATLHPAPDGLDHTNHSMDATLHPVPDGLDHRYRSPRLKS